MCARSRSAAEPLTESDVRSLHALVMRRSDPEIAGSYATSSRYVNTDSGRHTFPSPAEMPALMGDFAAWFGARPATPETAFAAHRRLVEIHPFNDGNGRTARLLINSDSHPRRLPSGGGATRGPPGLFAGLTAGPDGPRRHRFPPVAVRAPRRVPDRLSRRARRGAAAVPGFEPIVVGVADFGVAIPFSRLREKVARSAG